MAYDTQGSAVSDYAEPIAIVGVGCRLPGNISSVEDLFAVLRDGTDCITEVPPDRWSTDSYYDPDPVTPGKTYVRHGGFVTDIDRFDAAFFGISDAEAARMDPQQRMALQAVWHALESAGQSPEELVNSNTGVFLAMMNTNGYSQLKGAFEGITGVTAYDAMGDAMSIAAGRISHFFGLEGPCLALDTACSGSMVAVHLARQSILAGDCDSAIVAGVSAILHPGIHIAFSKVGLMSRSGRCRAFDENADGYIRSEGCMAVLLRRQSLAISRGDHILASIVGTAINQDGRTPALTAPNGATQEKVIRMALARVGVSADEIGYVEAHGTGTPVGDPIEMGALANVYGPGRDDGDPLYVGSVKSNFGHIESGAGLLGLVKAALSLDRQVIFPSLHFTKLNPNIEVGHAPLHVPTSPIVWPRGERRRMAGINSFGYSGTNAHAIVQEAPVDGNTPAAARPYEMLVLSAKSSAGLQELVDRWTDFLDDDGAPALGDAAFTAATGRSHLRHRIAVVGQGREDVGQKLRAWRQGRVPKGLAAGQAATRRKPKTAFVFTGQGSQYAGMGRQLYEAEPRFRAAIDRVAALMEPELGASLYDVLFGPASAEFLADTRYVQPALFAVEYALADVLQHWGIEPDYVIGHSVGEIVAACVARAVDLEGAVRFVTARGRLMGELPRGGRMIALDATAEEANEWIAGMEADVSLAAVNGPRSVVVSGRSDAIDAVAQYAISAGRRIKELEVSHAFHSPLMDPILDELTETARSMRISPAKMPIVSNVTGRFHTGGMEPGYWSSHVRRPVAFHQGMAAIIETGCAVIIEIGPHPALIPAIAAAFDTAKTRCLSTLMRGQQDVAHVLETLATLYATGAPLDLSRVFWSPAYRRVSLPLYPFRRDRHWIGDQVLSEKPPDVGIELHPLLGRAVALASRRAVFESTLSATSPWVDHRVLGSTVFPGSAYLEMATRGFAAFKHSNGGAVVLNDITFERPLLLAYRKSRKVNLTLEDRSSSSGDSTFVVSSTDDKGTEKYCRGRIGIVRNGAGDVPQDVEPGHKETSLPIPLFYGELRKGGLEYGANFSTVRELWLGKPDSGDAIGRVTASPHNGGEQSHPYTDTVLLDGCFQVFGAALQTLSGTEIRGAYVPASIRSLTLYRPLPMQVWSHVNVRTNADGRAATARIRILDGAGELLADIDGLELRQKASLMASDNGDSARAASGGEGTGESREQLIGRLQALPEEQQVAELAKWLAAEVKDILGRSAENVDIDNIDPSTLFVEIGLDSLLVTELQRRIQEKLAFRFQPMQGLDYQSIESLAGFILKEVITAPPKTIPIRQAVLTPAPAPAPTPTPDPAPVPVPKEAV